MTVNPAVVPEENLTTRQIYRVDLWVGPKGSRERHRQEVTIDEMLSMVQAYYPTVVRLKHGNWNDSPWEKFFSALDAENKEVTWAKYWYVRSE